MFSFTITSMDTEWKGFSLSFSIFWWNLWSCIVKLLQRISPTHHSLFCTIFPWILSPKNQKTRNIQQIMEELKIVIQREWKFIRIVAANIRWRERFYWFICNQFKNENERTLTHFSRLNSIFFLGGVDDENMWGLKWWDYLTLWHQPNRIALFEKVF